ncbi:damage-inducible protein CinA [Chryseobacterium sp. Leaf404]|uniref:CinA family protein n=1 Tax=unclassified Chryseobacterium TaxID=2593645 RepID=UPI0006FEAFC2|nr:MULTISPECIES: nicotinamide-nucleotide amidohydrolase family protein [unclassified Chryseobacterium]KQT18137.1 damage-inducible protein CinA [Chryseobacterium sp. Leaf404]
MQLNTNLLNYISESLIGASETVSVAESVTSGCLQQAFSQMSNATLFFKGGITAFNMADKIRILKINAKETSECEGVSENISEQMALKVAELFDTDWAIATTGYCSPGRDSSYKIFTYFSFVYKGQVILTKKLELHNKTESVTAQLYYTDFILGCFKSGLTQNLVLK